VGTRVNYGNTGNAAQDALEGWGALPTQGFVHEYLNTASTWGTWPSSGVWSAVGGFAPGFTTFTGPKMISLPMQVTSTPLLWSDVYGGSQDANLTQFFEYCVSIDCQNIRPGWEGNLASTTWPWGTFGNDTSGNQAGYVAAWQRIWNLAEAVASGYWNFWWCPDFPGGAYSMTNWEPGGAYYPGDQYVGTIGLDAYNTWAGGGGFPGDAAMLTALTTGDQPNWNTMLSYAIAHKKWLCIPEWGMNGDNALPNGGDDPTWINNVAGLFTTAAQTYGIPCFAGVWDNVGANPISGYPNSNTAVGTNVANWVSLGLTVGVGSLTIAPIANQSVTVNVPYGPYDASASGGTPPYTWSISGEPTGISIASGTGVISGTPTVVETTSTTVTVTDHVGSTAPTSFTFAVNASTLVLSTPSNQSATEGSSYSGTPATASGGTTPYVYSASLPSGLSIASSSGLVTGTPTVSGTIASSISVHDSTLPTNQTKGPNGFNFIIAPSGSPVPLYPPPGGVGSLLFNADFSTLSNQAGAGPMFKSTTGSHNNGGTGTDSEVNIVGGQLVLTQHTSTIGQVTCDNQGTYPEPSDGGFDYLYGYLECQLVVPTAGWWAVWISGDPWPTRSEFDIAENLSANNVSSNVHYGTTPGVQSGVWSGGTWPNNPSIGSTITIGCEWKSGTYTSYNAGVLQKTVNSGANDGGGVIQVASAANYILLTNGSAPTASSLKINYVRVWNL
jgi:Putative Ig domain